MIIWPVKGGHSKICPHMARVTGDMALESGARARILCPFLTPASTASSYLSRLDELRSLLQFVSSAHTGVSNPRHVLSLASDRSASLSSTVSMFLHAARRSCLSAIEIMEHARGAVISDRIVASESMAAKRAAAIIDGMGGM